MSQLVFDEIVAMYHQRLIEAYSRIDPREMESAASKRRCVNHYLSIVCLLHLLLISVFFRFTFSIFRLWGDIRYLVDGLQKLKHVDASGHAGADNGGNDSSLLEAFFRRRFGDVGS